jgi:PAS domain S-box-containing protein
MDNFNKTHVKTKRNFFSTNLFLVIFGFCLVAASVTLWKTQAARHLSHLYENTDSKARSYAGETEIRYNSIYQAFQRLASRGNPLLDTDEGEWEKDASFYLNAFAGIQSISWVDTSFRIQRIVPIQVDGSDLLQFAFAAKGKSSGVNLLVPVINDEEFIGFLFGIIDIDTFVAPISEEINRDYMFQLIRGGESLFESELWSPPREGLAVSKMIVLGNTTTLNLIFAPTSEKLHSAIVNNRRTLFLGLLLSFITIGAVYFAQNYNAIAILNKLRFRNLYEASQDAIFIINFKGEYRDANPSATKLVGYSLTELRKMTVDDLRVQNGIDPPAIRSHVWKEGGMLEISLRHKDGQKIDVELMISPIKDSKRQNNFMGIARNVTERKQMEQEQEKRRAQLMHGQRLESIGTLAGGVAHEINNPINGILNYAQLIKDKMENASSEYEYASEIIVETERVATIVENLLAFARQDKQSHSPARIADIVKGVTTLIQTIIRKDMIALEVDVPEDLPKLKCRNQQIQQVIMNLTTNARDALNQRYKEYDENKIIRINSSLFEREGRRWIRTTVEDHGSGIPAEVRERMFDPFYTTKDRSHGTGLGLSISHGIVQAHHGELTVKSEPGKFTRFHIDLPVDNGWEIEEKGESE